MHQVKKGNQWYFGMKAHIGVDVASGLVHTVVGAAANFGDIKLAGALLLLESGSPSLLDERLAQQVDAEAVRSDRRNRPPSPDSFSDRESRSADHP